jgi:ATP-binding protein involved in chromosome partitioning
MAASQSPPATGLLTGVGEIVAVHSAKGGVGKSTAATNLAAVFARMGMRVGLLDADVHGPSVAHMMGSSARPAPSPSGERVLPLERHGVRYLSLANVAAPDAPIIWRGPMVAGALQQLLSEVEWGDLDLLLIDLPPGTGDAILGAGQSVRLSGAVIVTTPQELSLSDTRRGIRAFEALQVPILGLLENMSVFECDGCGDRIALFGEGGGRAAAKELGIAFLGRIPIDGAVVRAGDAGVPLCASDPEGLVGRAFESAGRAILARLSLQGRAAGGAFDVTWERRKSGAFERAPKEAPRTAAAANPDTPVAVWQAGDDALGILWADGETTFHGAYELRMACPCARCVEEWTRRKMPSLAEVPKDVRPVTIRSVGRYALQPVWSDGHRTGIFAFTDLRRGTGAIDPRP